MLLFPFIIPLAFSFSYFDDRKYGTHNFFIIRNNKKTYYSAKAIVCFIGNFLIIVLPGLIHFLLLKITFVENNNTLFGQYKTLLYFNNLFVDDIIPVKAYYPFISLYIKNINLYNLIHFIFIGILTGMLGVFSYAISFQIKKNKILIFLPVYLIFQIYCHCLI